MNIFAKTYYRGYECGFALAAKCVPWPRPKTIVGAGCAKEIPGIFKKKKAKKVMIVSSQTSGTATVPKVTALLDAAGIKYVHFSDVKPNPTVKIVEEIYEMYKANGCDSFLAIGGGSSMDAAKAAAAKTVRPKMKVTKMEGVLKILHLVPLIVAVPTTAGTGSETTFAAVITDQETHHKFAIMDHALIPNYAVLDPELYTQVAPDITAATGMDALTHAVEAYLCVVNKTKETDAWAQEATVAIFKYLERSYKDGNDMEARLEMQIASFKAGYAFGRAGVGNVHAIAHTLGGLYNTPHGLANAVILPIVLEDYGKRVHYKLAHLASLTGVKTEGTIAERAQAFIDEIYAMNKRMGIPTGFDHIQEKDIPQMCKWAIHEANCVYPVPVLYDKKRFEKVIRKIIAKA